VEQSGCTFEVKLGYREGKVGAILEVERRLKR
jgi:hypothetical protein